MQYERLVAEGCNREDARKIAPLDEEAKYRVAHLVLRHCVKGGFAEPTGDDTRCVFRLKW